jgi:hypothetical protein
VQNGSTPSSCRFTFLNDRHHQGARMAKKQSSEARTARRAARGLAAAALLSALGSAHAADSLLITATGYSEDSQYAVLAAIIPFKGSSLGNG